MFFRIYTLMFAFGLSLLFTALWFMGTLIVIGLTLLTIRGESYYTQRNRTLATCAKSLSYGIQSIKTQKSNFHIINALFKNSARLKLFLKKISILLDDSNIRVTSGHCHKASVSRSHNVTQHQDYENYGVDIRHSIYSDNIYNPENWK